MIIKLKDLYHIYLEDTPLETLAIENINIVFGRHEIVSIIGKSGSGKSTLIQHLNGLLKPSKGKILIDGEDSNSKKFKNLTKKIGLVFQFPEAQLFEETVYDDIAFGPRNLGWDESKIKESINWAVNNISPEIKNIYHKSPFKLSGGEKRKVAICGILAMRPDMLCLDEPTAGLDPVSKLEFYKFIKNIYKQEVPVILITHDINDAFLYSDRIIIMQDGQIKEDLFKKKLKENMEILQKYDFNLPDVYKISKYLSKNNNIKKCFTTKELISQLDDLFY